VDYGTITFGALLVVLSLLLLAIHWNSWRKADHGGLSEREQDFHRRQFRRRIQSSGMLGLVGLLMLGSLWIEETWAQAMLWTGLLFALLWVIAMALLDYWASRTHYGRDQVLNTAEMEVLKAEIRKFEREQNQANDQ
jgi:hypothetical protein